MPNWIKATKESSQFNYNDSSQTDVSTFSAEQRLAYNSVKSHFISPDTDEPLLLIINGVGGTGKSYLIGAIRDFLGTKCAITASSGKTAFNVRGVTVYSLLRLPVRNSHQNDLTGQTLAAFQECLSENDYIVIDEYSMTGQKTLGWIDRRCRQSTGRKSELFGGKSIILTGDPHQLPPVCDKQLCHSKPSSTVGEQGYYAYKVSTK